MIDYKEIRHQLHEHPQTAGNEQFAHDMIVRHLQGLHPDKVYTNVGGYGVIAVWEAQNSSIQPLSHSATQPLTHSGTQPLSHSATPTIAFRADTDALPIGHRCGHDGHTTILLRLAELIDEVFSAQCSVCSDATRDGDSQLNTKHSTLNTDHNILLLWQPAEETGTGSQAILESGILQQYNIVRFYGLHNLPGYPLGTVVLCPHTFAAASTGIIYHLDGRETHASTPELGLNPGLAVAEIIQKFNGLTPASLPGRGDLPTTDCVSLPSPLERGWGEATLICVRLGSPAFGTSAGHAEVMFTLRAFTNDAMEQLLADANAAVDEIAARHGLKVSRMLQEPFHATENDPDCVEEIRKACEAQAPQDNFQFSTFNFQFKDQSNRWSEDFAEYLLRYKGAMFGIGSGEHQPELHHPDYDFPDALVEPAARLFFRLATACTEG